MKKSFNIFSFSKEMMTLVACKCGQSFSSKEITDLLKKFFNVRTSNEVLSSLENHGVLSFSNFRTCKFEVECSFCTPENLIKLI